MQDEGFAFLTVIALDGLGLTRADDRVSLKALALHLRPSSTISSDAARAVKIIFV
jgi:hypothetical protein